MKESILDVKNLSIQYHTDLLGPITLIGPGAGRKETAAALIEDLIHIVL